MNLTSNFWTNFKIFRYKERQLTLQSSPFCCSRISDNNPKIDSFFTAKFFIIPTFFDTNSSIRFNSYPRIFISNFKSFMFRFFFQLKYNFSFNLSIGFSKFGSFCRSDSSSSSSFLSVTRSTIAKCGK